MDDSMWRGDRDNGLIQLPEGRHRLSSRYGQRREREEYAETSNDENGPEGVPLKRVPLVFPQRQEATTADHRHQRKLLHDINTEWKTNSPRPARINESFELSQAVLEHRICIKIFVLF